MIVTSLLKRTVAASEAADKAIEAADALAVDLAAALGFHCPNARYSVHARSLDLHGTPISAVLVLDGAEVSDWYGRFGEQRHATAVVCGVRVCAFDFRGER